MGFKNLFRTKKKPSNNKQQQPTTLSVLQNLAAANAVQKNLKIEQNVINQLKRATVNAQKINILKRANIKAQLNKALANAGPGSYLSPVGKLTLRRQALQGKPLTFGNNIITTPKYYGRR